jgi:hypothetical protein
MALSCWGVVGWAPRQIFGEDRVMGAVSLSLYKGHRYPAEIISHCGWLYHRFPLSFREVRR